MLGASEPGQPLLVDRSVGSVKPSTFLLGFFVRRKTVKPIGLALLLLMMRAPHGSAQEQAKRYEIHTLRFDGNTIISSGVLRSVVVTRQTPGLFWRILYKVSEKLGEKPEYYDPVVFSGDLLRLRKWYRDQGFFHSLVDSAIVYDDEDETVDLTCRENGSFR